jgi:hypothetical protein
MGRGRLLVGALLAGVIVAATPASSLAAVPVLTQVASVQRNPSASWTLPRLTIAAMTPRVYAPDCGGRPRYKPRTIIVACGDGNLSLRAISWFSWTSSTATGVGVYYWNDCIPACYRGHFHSRAGARVSLYRVTRCVSKRFTQFTRMRVTPPVSLPRFKPFAQRLSCAFR